MKIMWKLTIIFLNVLFNVINCDLDCKNYPVVTDFGPDDCDKTNNLYYNPTMYGGCIPGCDERATLPLGSCKTKPCPPGYLCNTKNQCEVDEDSCFKYQTKDYENSRFKANCLTDGSWAGKQCKGDRCFCYGPKGKRIFGDAFSDQATNMTCACSRERAEMEEKKHNFFISLHCDSIGNYEPLQCQERNCWCVEPKTGKLTAPIVPEILMTRLPCYDKAAVGEQYLRQCESQLYAQEKIKDEYNAHGTTKTRFSDLKCLYDGNFGPTKIESGQQKCVWKDNSPIGSYFVDGADSTMNCNCARDSKIFELAGKELLQKCDPNGNYSPVQKDGDLYYCVDSDGYRKNEPQETLLDTEYCKNIKE